MKEVLLLIGMIFTTAGCSKKDDVDTKIKESLQRQLVAEENPLTYRKLGAKSKYIYKAKSKEVKLGVYIYQGYELLQKYKAHSPVLTVTNIGDNSQNFSTSYSAFRLFSITDGNLSIEFKNNVSEDVIFMIYESK